VEVTSLRPEERFDTFDDIGTLAGHGQSETCTRCRRDFAVSALLRGSEGAICLGCGLQIEHQARARQSRWDLSKLVAAVILLVLSSTSVPLVGGLALIGEQAWHPVFFLGGTTLGGMLSCLLVVSTLRDLRFDLAARDPILLGKHMFTLAFATVVNGVVAGVFCAALFQL